MENKTKYISIDIETLGNDVYNDQIVEFAAVIDEFGSDVPVEDLPHFNCLVLQENNRYAITPYLSTWESHRKILELLSVRDENETYVYEDTLVHHFTEFIEAHGFKRNEPRKLHDISIDDYKYNFIAVGKNFSSFDSLMLDNRICGWKENFRIKHILDLGALHFDPSTDVRFPYTEEVFKRANVDANVSHRALDDARDAVRVIRSYYAQRCNVKG